MTTQQRKHIRDLVKKYSGNCGTESLIGFVADSSGMLDACRELLTSIDAADSSSAEWLQRECSQHKVALHTFLQEVTKIVALFQSSRQANDHYLTLNIPDGATQAEIKQAYRILSRRYHPDTAAPEDARDPEKFIAITKAYHSLIEPQRENEQAEHFNPSERQFVRNKPFTVLPRQRRNMVLWGLGLLAILLIVSIVGTMNIRKKAMLAGLQESRGAFVPPVTKPSVGHSIAAQLFRGSPSEKRAVEPVVTETTPAITETQQPKPAPEHTTVSGATELSEEQLLPEKTPVVPLKEGPHKKILIAHNQQPEQEQRHQQKQKSAVSPPIETSVETKQPEDRSEPVPDAYNQRDRQETIVEEAIPTETSVAAHTDNSKPGDVHIETEPSGTTTAKLNKELQHNIPESKPVESEVQPVTAMITDQLPEAATHKVEKVADEDQLQLKINNFLKRYVDVYSQRNLILFAKFFADGATENGKPFAKMMSTYRELFASTSALDLNVYSTSWQQDNSKVSVKGTFTVFIQYNDSRTLSGTGGIDFILLESTDDFVISRLTYDFSADK